MLRYVYGFACMLVALGSAPAMADTRYEGGFVVRYASGACRAQGLQKGSFGRVTLRPRSGAVTDTVADFFQDQVAWSVQVVGASLYGTGAYQATLIGARVQSASQLAGAFTVTGDVIHEGRQFVRLHGDFTNFFGIPGCRVLARLALSRVEFGHKFLPPRRDVRLVHSSYTTHVWRGQMTIVRASELCPDYKPGMTFTAFLAPKSAGSFTEGFSYLILQDGMRIWSLSVEAAPYTFIGEGRYSLQAFQGYRFPGVSRNGPFRNFAMYSRDLTSSPSGFIFLRGVLGGMFYEGSIYSDCEVEVEGAFAPTP